MSVEGLVQELASQPTLGTAQEAMRWHPATWRKWLGEHPESRDALEAVISVSAVSGSQAQISRDDVRRLAAGGDGLTTFVASQVWGHGTSGYGAYRVATILGLTQKGGRLTSFESSRTKLAEAQRLCQTAGAVGAYRYLVNREGKLPQLAVSFLTKYLYFVPDPAPPTPLILDQVVQGVIERHTRERLRLRFGRTDYYEDYLCLVSELVERLESACGIACTPDEVEIELFRMGRPK